MATVNDYLAKRDAELMGPVYQALGLSVGFLQQKMEDGERQAVYRNDVTYGTASEFGFDFLPRSPQAQRRAGGEHPVLGPVDRATRAIAGRSAGPARPLFRSGRRSG